MHSKQKEEQREGSGFEQLVKRKRRKEARGLYRLQKEKSNNGNTQHTLVVATTAETFTIGRENSISKPLRHIAKFRHS
jgi:hypothetical protein